MSDEDELEKLRKKKLEELQQQVAQQQFAEAQQQEFETKKYQIMRKILTQEGRQRLENIRIVKPEFAQQIEFQLIQLAQAGRLKGPLSDAAFKKLLEQLAGKKKDFKIKKFDQNI
ncbi:MAG: DNA-binding protein [Candidatus Thorarchaeota archaeon]